MRLSPVSGSLVISWTGGEHKLRFEQLFLSTRSGPMVLRSCCCGSVISTIIKSGVFRRSLSCLSKASDLRYPRCPMIALLIFEERRIIILLPAMAALSVLDSSEWHKRKSWPRCVLYNLEERTPAIEQCSWVPDFPQKQIAVPVMVKLSNNMILLFYTLISISNIVTQNGKRLCALA
ncbi:uncharacterized protein LOC144116115 isoform X3 [Amblyomma americanum]